MHSYAELSDWGLLYSLRSSHFLTFSLRPTKKLLTSMLSSTHCARDGHET